MKKLLLLIPLILFLVSGESFAQVSEAYKVRLSEMLRLTDFEDNYSSAIKQVVSLHKEVYPANVPEKLWKEFEKEIQEASWPFIMNELASIYSNYYTLSDLEEIIKFYQSSTGKKMIAHTIAITQESMVLFKELGPKIRKELNYKLKQNGYE